MDWQTVLRATVPLGAAVLAVVAVFAARRDRAARRIAGPPPMGHAAEGPLRVERIPRLRGAPAPIAGSLAPAPPRSSALPRALAALVLVLLFGATGLVFTMSRPLADVDIEVVSLSQACRGSEPCPSPRRVSVRGSVAASGGRRDVTVLVLVRTRPKGEWSVVAEAQPNESGAWTVADVAAPPDAGPTLEVRAVVSTPSARVYAERDTETGVAAATPASRVVRVAPEMPAPALEREP